MTLWQWHWPMTMTLASTSQTGSGLAIQHSDRQSQEAVTAYFSSQLLLQNSYPPTRCFMCQLNEPSHCFDVHNKDKKHPLGLAMLRTNTLLHAHYFPWFLGQFQTILNKALIFQKTLLTFSFQLLRSPSLYWDNIKLKIIIRVGHC